MERQSYCKPEIWVEKLEIESPLLANTITDIKGVTGGTTILGYGGGGNGPARSGENNLWDDEEEDSGWDNL